MYKTCNVVMLPTNEKSNIGLIKSTNRLYYSEQAVSNESQHIYITSDEEIKDDDWCVLDLNENTRIVRVKSLNSGHSIFTVDIIDGYAQLNNLKKIIATTDALPIYKAGIEVGLFVPQIPQQFIQYYIEEYNKGNIITKVEVEYEVLVRTDSPFNRDRHLNDNTKVIPKLNSDNTINIKPIKDSWNREEVIEFGSKMFLAGLTEGYKCKTSRTDYKKYTIENLIKEKLINL